MILGFLVVGNGAVLLATRLFDDFAAALANQQEE
jgi:hypothetical protein